MLKHRLRKPSHFLWIFVPAILLAPLSGPDRLPAVSPTFAVRNLAKTALSSSERYRILSAEHPRFLLLLREQADLGDARSLTGKEEKTAFVYRRLSAIAARSQPALLAQLKARGCSVTSLTIVNGLAVECPDRASLAPEMDRWQSDESIARVEPDPAVALTVPLPSRPTTESIQAPAAVEWNIQKIGAPQAWAAGFRGESVVIGNQDTGFQWNHPALIRQYRGWNGTTADHNYNWWDAIRDNKIVPQSVNPCGYQSSFPCDDHGHGTHTMGIAVGDDGQGNQVGVAPGARWIGCRNMDAGVGRPSTYLECFDFFLAPWDLQKNNRDTALAPDIINNSWSCPGSELCTGQILLLAVENVRAAGIMVVVAAGNSGPGCGTISEEPGSFDSSTTVGSTDSTDKIASSSSRGLVVLPDGGYRMKPDLTAPGVGIRSSIRNSGYGTMSGTSMATPHVAGAAAVLFSAYPILKGNVDRTETLLLQTAVRLTSTLDCHTSRGSQFPNAVFGWGRLDLWTALQQGPMEWKMYFPLFVLPPESGTAFAPRSRRLLGTP